LIQLDQDT